MCVMYKRPTNKMSDKQLPIIWSDPLENVIKELGEQSQALAWVHDAAQRWCSNWSTRLIFPCIILSTLSGAGSVGASSLLPFNGAATLVGIISLLVGMLQTVQTYFKFPERSEAHRIAALQYGKIRSQLDMQLSLSRAERKSAEELVQWLTSENERLAEIVPQLPKAIIVHFKKTFQSTETSIPSILNGLDPMFVNKMDQQRNIRIIVDERRGGVQRSAVNNQPTAQPPMPLVPAAQAPTTAQVPTAAPPPPVKPRITVLNSSR